MTLHRQLTKKTVATIAKVVPRDVPLVAIDPGAQGVALLWERGVVDWPSVPTRRCSLGDHGSGHRQAAEWCAKLGVRVVLVEDQFVGASAHASVRIARSAGLIVGAIQHAAPTVTDVVWTPPSVWQRVLPPGPSTKERSLMLAHRLLGPWIAQQAPSPLQEACADVIGMVAFFEEVTRVQVADVGF